MTYFTADLLVVIDVNRRVRFAMKLFFAYKNLHFIEIFVSFFFAFLYIACVISIRNKYVRLLYPKIEP